MREILFRGKRIYNGEWVEGSLLKGKKGDADCAIIVPEKELQAVGLDFCVECDRPYDESFEAFPETVGQYTGLTDKKGKKIFEGDIVKGYFNDKLIRGVVVYGNDATFFIQRKGLCGIGLNNGEIWIEVIGNIHDNPELLEEK